LRGWCFHFDPNRRVSDISSNSMILSVFVKVKGKGDLEIENISSALKAASSSLRENPDYLFFLIFF
jgi:hypothetical protein